MQLNCLFWQIFCLLCHGEKTVGQLIDAVKTTQLNMSPHLNLLQRKGISSKWREGVQIDDGMTDNQIVESFQTVCDRLKYQR